MFQSTPPRGRRLAASSSVTLGASFNPRLRAGGDALRQQALHGGVVSIHASAREATIPTGCRRHRRRVSNPRLRAGGDAWLQASIDWLASFNPRLRAGGDIFRGCAYQPPRVSIHASAREATPS